MIYVKKRIASTLFLGLTIFALTAQSAEACSAFIIGKDLTTDGYKVDSTGAWIK